MTDKNRFRIIAKGGIYMRHEVTSLNTKKLIANSLKKAMKTKPLSKITVSELIRDCGINRNTFYYHFDDIYEIGRAHV